MKLSMYIHYPVRSLLREKQLTMLGIFCVAVGVMALVSLQLVGQMINDAFTSNIRDANGGDIAVITPASVPFRQSDLVFFDQLKRNGTISSYTPFINASGSTSLSTSITQPFSVIAVDPQSFPLVTPPTFLEPASGKLATLLTPHQVVIDHALAGLYNKRIGDSFTAHITTSRNGFDLPVQVAGIISDTGIFVRANDFLVMSTTDYRAGDPSIPLAYDRIDITTPDKTRTAQAVKAINDTFDDATTTTVDQALQNNQTQVDSIKKFLEIAGLLALLIGGVGIVNTMQVLLSRRTIEIAMLKTTGYRRFDLYWLFGLESALLGLSGGVIGATAAMGVSYLVLSIVQQIFPIRIPFFLDPVIIVGGIIIGLATALIFGLLPIVQAANIRPLNVIRDLPEGKRTGNVTLTILLLLFLSVLFCIMATIILKDVIWGIGAVYGAFIFLGILSLLFSLVVAVISRLPVPERINIRVFAFVSVCLVISALLFLPLPAFGGLLFVLSLISLSVVLWPRLWKSTTKLALRNIGRRRVRTTTTLLALFVGVFAIGVIQILGQDLRDSINTTIASSLDYNLVIAEKGADGQRLQSQIGTFPNLNPTHVQPRTYTQIDPVAIDGVPLQQLVSKTEATGLGNVGRTGALYFLSGMEGYDVARRALPNPTDASVAKGDGRNLTASDAGTNNVLVNTLLNSLAPLKGHIHVGSTLTLSSVAGKTMTVKVVGFYSSGLVSLHFGPILAPNEIVKALTPAGQETTLFYIKVDTDKIGQLLDAVGKLTPNATANNFANIGDFINTFTGDALLILTTIASLSLLAGVIIIANTVVLAMLERRRELGILKSVGYTSRRVLSEVLIENGIVGGTAASIAMLLVTLVTSLLGTFFFKANFGVNPLITLGLIVGGVLLAMVAAGSVAWSAVRVRPLTVLRYE